MIHDPTDPASNTPMSDNASTSAALVTDIGKRLDSLSLDVVALAEINSGSYNPGGVNRVGERVAELMAGLGPDRSERIDVPPAQVMSPDGVTRPAELGSALRVQTRPDAPFQVCLFGHLDTVFAPDHPFQAVAVDGHHLAGPGVADCKGGLIIAAEVARAIDRAPWGENVGWELLVVPDEEIGSNSSKHLLAEAAQRCDLGVGFEPALPSGGIAGARKGALTAHTLVRGLAAHAGRAHHEGRSAILGLALLITELEALNMHPDVTVNTGKIAGGGALNVVPDFAIASYNLRVKNAEAQRWVEQRFAEVVAASQLEVELTWTSARPPKERTAELELLLDDVATSAAALGLSIQAEDTGGCCDGNDLAAAGLPNVDSLGIVGGGIHSTDEFADVSSIPERAAVVVEVVRRAAVRADR